MVIGDSKSNSLISIKRLTLQQKAKVSATGLQATGTQVSWVGTPSPQHSFLSPLPT